MRRFLTIGALLLGSLVAPTSAYANHGMVNDAPACGTYEMHLEDDYVKGRTDALIYHAEFTVGCKHSILSGVVPAGNGEAQGNAWQWRMCSEFALDHAVRNADYYWHEKISPADVKVSCSPWKGHD